MAPLQMPARAGLDLIVALFSSTGAPRPSLALFSSTGPPSPVLKLHRYLARARLPRRGRSVPLRRGCGVTAYGLDDARVLQATLFEGRERPAITKAIVGVDIRTLDQRHVVPYMGVVT